MTMSSEINSKNRKKTTKMKNITFFLKKKNQNFMKWGMSNERNFPQTYYILVCFINIDDVWNS